MFLAQHLGFLLSHVAAEKFRWKPLKCRNWLNGVGVT